MGMLQFGFLHLGLESDFPIEEIGYIYGECHVACESSAEATATVVETVYGECHISCESSVESTATVGSAEPAIYGECHITCRANLRATASIRTVVSDYENERRVTMGGAWAVGPPPSKKKKKVKLTFNVFGDEHTQEAVEPDEIIGLIIGKVAVVPGSDPIVISLSEFSCNPQKAVGLKLVGEIEKKTLYTETKR